MQKVWDSFSFFCETELLELRIKHLWDYVDYFVITEANMTHQAEPKKFLLSELLDGQLAWAKEKIKPIYLEVSLDDLPDTKYLTSEEEILGNCKNSLSWKIENFQRNAAMQELALADEEDIIMIGDLDEFPNWKVMSNLETITQQRELYAIGMLNYPYYLNVKLEVDGDPAHWAGTVVGKKKHLITPQLWRDVRELVHWNMKLGYHFTWLVEWMPKKIISTAHEEIAKLYNADDMVQRAKALEDMYAREGYKYSIAHIIDDEWFPKCILESLDDEKIKKLICKI